MSENILDDVASLTVGYAFKSSEFVEPSEGTRLVRCDNIGHGSIRWDGAKAWRPTNAEIEKTYSLEVGDVVVAMDRPWIASGLKRAVVQDSDLPSLLVQRVARLRAKPGTDQGFIRVLVESKDFTDHILSVQTGTTVPHVSGRQILSFSVPKLPPIAEQRAIAGVLGALDDRIESNRRIWKTALQLISVARANAASVEVTHLKSLGQLADFNLNTTRPGPSEDKIVYIDIASVTPGSIEKRQVVTWSDAPSRARRGVRDGDLIFSTVRPGRRSFAVILNPDPRTVISTGFAVMTPKNCGTSFLAAVIADEEFADYCETVAQGSAYPAVSPEAMSRFEVEVPSVEALDKFESMYLPILRRGDRAQAENVILSNMRDALLPELLSGRLRVRDTEKFVEDSV